MRSSKMLLHGWQLDGDCASMLLLVLQCNPICALRVIFVNAVRSQGAHGAAFLLDLPRLGR